MFNPIERLHNQLRTNDLNRVINPLRISASTIAPTIAASPPRRPGVSEYHVLLPKTFGVVVFFLSILLASFVGALTRIMLISNHHNSIAFTNVVDNQITESLSVKKSLQHLGGMSTNLHVDRSATVELSATKLTKNKTNFNAYVFDLWNTEAWNDTSSSLSTVMKKLQNDDTSLPIERLEITSNEDLHFPLGQHLLIDIKNVDSFLLNSEQLLSHAMLELGEESRMTLLSKHCHALIPEGVSCVGISLKSHIALHTWPLKGVISLDLVTCGHNSLIPILSSIQRVFGVPLTPEYGIEFKPTITMKWAHKLRGFRETHDSEYDQERNPLGSDLERYVLGSLDFDVKRLVVSSRTEFQAVDVYELLHPKQRRFNSYAKSFHVQADENGDEDKGDESHDYFDPKHFGSNRILFLDGVIQSSLYGDAPYHESIVHPAMIAHSTPKKVAIIGGGEGATLREVLKHSTVEKVVMIEIDKNVVELSHKYLPEWSDCSDIINSADWCFEDGRVETKFIDAIEYFKETFKSGHEKEELYDVIVMDALDPNDGIEFAVELYTMTDFIQSLFDGLTASGILAVQVGEVPFSYSPSDEMGSFLNRALMLEKLQAVGFKAIHMYEESHSGFLGPWSTLVAFKDCNTRKEWYRNAAHIDLQIHRRIRKTKSGKHALRYFDGATMLYYQSIPKSVETIYCRNANAPDECHRLTHFNSQRSSKSYDMKKGFSIITSVGNMTKGVITDTDALIEETTNDHVYNPILSRMHKYF